MAQFASANDYQLFARSVKFKSRYIRTPKEEEFLNAVRILSKERLITKPATWKFYRAQRGYCEGLSEAKFYNDAKTERIPAAKPYPRERMKPLSKQASEGRVNPTGIPCLYGATSPHIAVAEVRPWKEELISVATLSLYREVKIVEFLRYHDEDPNSVFMNTATESVLTEEGTSHIQELPSNEDVSNDVWTSIDQAFSEPVTHADNHADYAPTQILVEVLKEQDYDGVFCRSRLSSKKGFNIAFFNPDVAAVSDVCLYKVQDVEVKSEKCGTPWIDPYSGKPMNFP